MLRAGDAARLLTLGAIWGSSYFLIKVALEDFGPLGIVAARIVIGAAVLTTLLKLRGLALTQAAVVLRPLAFMAVLGNVIPFLLITWGEKSISSSLTAILNSTTPLFTVGLAAALLPSERLQPVRLIGIVGGFAGVGIIVGVNPEGSSVPGQLAVVGAALSYAIAFVYARRHLTPRGLPPLLLPAAQLLISSFVIVPFAAVEVLRAPPEPALATVASILALGVLGTGWAYVLYYRLISDVGATTASFVTYLIPLFGVALGVAVLDERLTLNVFVGGALVVAGIALAELTKREAAPEPEPATK